MNGDGVSSDSIWASWMRLTCFFYYNNWSINDSANKRDNIDYLSEHNNKYNKEDKNNELLPSWFNKELEVVPPSQVELEEMEDIINSFN